MMTFIDNFVFLFIESAPFLLLGMFIAGVINQLVPKSWVEKTLGKSSSVTTAAIIGAPVPLCSCSVIPVAMGIRRRGASKASTASFLVATPETGVDSIGITYALMGPVMAIARPVSAIFSAIMTGWSIKALTTETPPKQPEQEKESCCGGNKSAKPEGLQQNLKAVFSYGFGKLLRDFMKWLLIGLFFAALIQTFVPSDTLAQYGSGIGAMALVVLVSIPMYICATASTPIAVGLMMSGISPGAALVFMLTGPATNIATLMVIKNELGKKALAIYLTAIITSAMACGLILDWLIKAFGLNLNLVMGDHGEMTSLLYQVSAVVLALLIVFQFSKAWLSQRKVQAA